MSFGAEDVLSAHGPTGDAASFLVAADAFLAGGDRHLAASALDRAYGLAPRDEHVARQRQSILDELAISEHGLTLRYVPAGTFLMGSTEGDPDERPVHPVRLDRFWTADVPMTWSAFCTLMDWEPAPGSHPRERDADVERGGFHLRQTNKIRMQYCESDGSADAYDTKPMVAVGWEEAEELAARLSTDTIRYALPTEAQWEKAARGGLVGRRWSWGDEPPTAARCDFGHFGKFWLADPRSLAPNGYGLYGMCGSVWEWTATTYDALAYHHASRGSAAGGAAASSPADVRRVLRGGSWADCAEAASVSFRTARTGASWRRGAWSGSATPNVGFRLVRVERGR